MWEVALQNKYTGEFMPFSSYQTLAEAKSCEIDKEGVEIYYLWIGDFPENKKDLDDIIQQEFDANLDKDFSIVIGADIKVTHTSKQICRCPGQCFCIRTRRGCRCQVFYRGRWYNCASSC